MDLCDQAMAARSIEDHPTARDLFRSAFEREFKAAGLVAPRIDFEPTRSVLHRSAAALALEFDDYRSAEKLIAIALAGEPPEEIAEELRNLLEQVHFQRHLELRGLQLSKDEFQLSISGKATAHGMAQSDAFVDRVQCTEKLLFRTIERKLNRPFRETGRAIKEVSDNFELYLSVPRAASFAVTLKVGMPQKQLNLPTLEEEVVHQPDAIIDELLDCLEAFDREDETQLEELIPDAAYRRNFVALVDQLAPDGEQIKVVGLTVKRGAIERSVAVRKNRLAGKRRQADNRRREDPIEVEGTLRLANSLEEGKDQIRIVDETGKSHKFRVPSGMMADIVKPLWNERVVVAAVRRGKSFVLERITKAENVRANGSAEDR